MSVGRSRASLFLGGLVERSLAGQFERAVDEIARDDRFAGVEIVNSGTRGSGRTLVLHVTIDREGGVDVRTCERIAATINARLQAFEEPYALEVESAGLNRPLTKPGDYERFSGRDAKIVTSLQVRGNKTHRGVLRGVRGTAVILQTESGELPLPLETIKTANLEYDVRADLKRAKEQKRQHA
jgi:ribosome maturation factor RimP